MLNPAWSEDHGSIAHMFDKDSQAALSSRAPNNPDAPYPVAMLVARRHAALVALLRTVTSGKGEHWSDVTARILDLGSADRALIERTDPQHLFDDGTDTVAARRAAERDLKQWAASGWKFISILDADYPARLRDIHQAPPFLFAEGQLHPNETAVAVVGSRKASEYSLGVATAIATRLVDAGVSVLSVWLTA